VRSQSQGQGSKLQRSSFDFFLFFLDDDTGTFREITHPAYRETGRFWFLFVLMNSKSISAFFNQLRKIDQSRFLVGQDTAFYISAPVEILLSKRLLANRPQATYSKRLLPT
jgi:hypothetical protein